ncbi:MAG TPA: DivIVA domain-containing protein [Acidimicrobiales bacterium]|nr:DivIVA domain-containing protein [Acidimicrobiales bacterium]
MDSPKAGSSQQSSLDSLRTVEFRQTLRGYHIDDVDEYLERVAIEAEALQEQMRQSGDRMRQAAERIAQLEQTVQHLEQQLEQAPSAGAPAAPAVADDTLQRTLLLAQKFVEQTEAEAEAQARTTLAAAEERARTTLADAETRARALTEETERHLREDISRLESIRTQLAGDVETIARHLDTERNRLRGALGDMLAWVDEHVQPAATLLAQPSAPTPSSSGSTPATTPPGASTPGTSSPGTSTPGTSTPGTSTPAAAASGEASPSRTGSDAESRTPSGGQPTPAPRTSPSGQSNPGGSGSAPGPRPTDADAASVAERQGTMPLSDAEGARAGVPR